MKTRFLAILAFLFIPLLLTACATTRRTQVPQPIQVTQIKENFSTPAPQDGSALDQVIDYSMYPPGSVLIENADGTLTMSRTVPELVTARMGFAEFPEGVRYHADRRAMEAVPPA